MDVEILSRIQFAFTIAFHYIFPPLSIGLGVLLVVMEGFYLKTKKQIFLLQQVHFQKYHPQIENKMPSLCRIQIP